jgi:chromosomal replication initiation ATPase DnaA
MGSIIEACAAAWQLTPEQLFAPTRRQPIATARQMAMALCMERTSATQWQVAAFCGKSQHGTVACAVRAVRAHCDTDRRFAATWAALNAALTKSEE